MTLLPVVERELRVAARERGTYRVRFVAAAITVFFSGFSLWFVSAFLGDGPIPPRELFVFLTWIAYIFVFFAGYSLTCDAISQEKRDATLGLLFLTDLKGYDVVLGKFSVAAIRGIYALLATIPVLALPLMMGGTNLGELARTTLTLLITLLFSMGVGIAVSPLARKNWSAFSASGFIAFIFALGIPAYSEFVRAVHRSAELAHYLELPSPTFAMYMSFRTAIGLSGNDYALSLGIILLLTLTAVVIASLTTPHVWKDRPPARLLARILEASRNLKFGAPRFRERFRRRLLDRNPLFWLSRRERVSSLGLMLGLLAAGAVAGWVGYQDWTVLGPKGNEIFPVVAWFIATILGHLLLLLRLAVIAAERFGEDRRSGALELILSTPISIQKVLAGHWMGLLRYFAGPALIAFGLQALALAFLFTLEEISDEPRSFVQVVADIFRHLNGILLHPQRWELHFFVVILVTLFPMLVMHWIALGWVSTWRSLRAKHALIAPVTAILTLHLPPPIIFAFVVGYIEDNFRTYFSHGFSQVLLLYTTAAGLMLTHQLLCIWWCRRQIYKHFRTAATDRYQPARARRWWQFGLG